MWLDPLYNDTLTLDHFVRFLFSLRSKRFGKAFRTFDALFAFLAAGKLGRAQKMRGGEGKGEKETLACKLHDFENPVRPQMEFSDWRGMVVLIAK